MKIRLCASNLNLDFLEEQKLLTYKTGDSGSAFERKVDSTIHEIVILKQLHKFIKRKRVRYSEYELNRNHNVKTLNLNVDPSSYHTEVI